jgi:eukaryotic-like serine/threonine-protein kinase
MPFDGMQLGNYRLLRLIGRGGMGEVYLAEDIRTPRQLAVKITQIDSQPLLSHAETVGEVSRLFHREMQVIISLDHPNILPLIDFGETVYEQHSTLLYIVMPYRPEGSFANWLVRQQLTTPLTLSDATSFLLQAADALQHAHDHHVVHQDVKLANFLVREHPNRRPDLLLTDFGIARVVSSNSTQSHQFRGTPNAMPPEQWDGEPVPASDQYALAVMAYQLLTGRPPFIGSMEQVMRQHFTKQPDPPSQLNPELPAGVDEVILQALAKSPEQRYPSITAFAEALQQFSSSTYSPLSFQTTPTFSTEESLPTQKSVPTPVLPPPVISYSQPAMTPQMVSPLSELVSSQQTTVGPSTGFPLPSDHNQPTPKHRISTLVLALLALLLIVPAGIITVTQVHQAQVRSERATAEAVRQTTLAHRQATHSAATAQVTYAAATATAQANAACYNQNMSLGPYALSSNIYLLPSHDPWLSTSSICHSVNVKFSQLTAPIQMQICFIDTRNCNDWTDITTTNQWYQLTANVPAKISYRFGIKSTQNATIQFTFAG